jgi:hypothetical protein
MACRAAVAVSQTPARSARCVAQTDASPARKAAASQLALQAVPRRAVWLSVACVAAVLVASSPPPALAFGKGFPGCVLSTRISLYDLPVVSGGGLPGGAGAARESDRRGLCWLCPSLCRHPS